MLRRILRRFLRHFFARRCRRIEVMIQRPIGVVLPAHRDAVTNPLAHD
jgi:hypothetical protein